MGDLGRSADHDVRTIVTDNIKKLGITTNQSKGDRQAIILPTLRHDIDIGEIVDFEKILQNVLLFYDGFGIMTIFLQLEQNIPKKMKMCGMAQIE